MYYSRIYSTYIIIFFFYQFDFILNNNFLSLLNFYFLFFIQHSLLFHREKTFCVVDLSVGADANIQRADKKNIKYYIKNKRFTMPSNNNIRFTLLNMTEVQMYIPGFIFMLFKFFFLFYICF